VPGEGAEGLGVAASELGHVEGGRVEAGQDEEPQAFEGAQGHLAALNQEGDLDEAAFEGSHAGGFGGGHRQPAGGGGESFDGLGYESTGGRWASLAEPKDGFESREE